MNIDNFEVFTTADKVQRDALFKDFRDNGDRLEKQVVKFSSVQAIRGNTGLLQGYRSVYSVAYPKNGDRNPTRRTRLRQEAKDRNPFGKVDNDQV